MDSSIQQDNHVHNFLEHNDCVDKTALEEQKLKLARQIKYILDTRHTVPVDTEYPYENDIADFILGRDKELERKARIEEVKHRYTKLILTDIDEFKWKEFAEKRIEEIKGDNNGNR